MQPTWTQHCGRWPIRRLRKRTQPCRHCGLPALDPAAPFVSGQAGWWTLPADAVLLDEENAREVPAPYPALVTIGSTETGELVLLNLAQVPALLMEGNPVHITEVCTALALELGMSRWASEVEIVTVRFGDDLPQLLPTARIAHMRQAAHALRDLSERLLEAHQMPETEHQPYLLLCASSLDADTAWQFANLIDKSGTLPVTLIAPASTAAAHFPDAEVLNASLSDPQHLDYAAGVQITTALQMSAQPPHPAEGPWQDIPDEIDVTQPAEQTERDELTAPAATAFPNDSSAAPSDASSEVFPALLAASTDPSAPRPLPTATIAGAASGSAPSTEPFQLDHQSGDMPLESTQVRTTVADPRTPKLKRLTEPEPEVPALPSPAERTSGTQDAEADDREASLQERQEPAAEDHDTHDLHAPEVRVLGPVEVTGVDSTGHGPRMAQFAALLLFRPGRTADVLRTDMDPVNSWSLSTLNARLQRLRRSMLVCDGLRGLPDAVGEVWPKTVVQTCAVHLLRASFRYAARQDWDKIAKALKPVYTAPTEDAATSRFLEFCEEWGQKYPAIVRLWENAWAEFVPFLQFDAEIRRIV